MRSASETLAGFAADLTYDRLPPAVLAKVKLHLLDLCGVALAACGSAFATAVVEVARAMGGPSTCTAVGCRDRMPAAWAALVNGTLAHGLDFDDTHTESVLHVSASVVPAALAACEAAAADGRAFLTALALGMEANVRIGLVARGAFHDRGFHPTGICGTYASALVAGKVLGLGTQQLADALGLAGSQAAGSLEFLTDGTWAKRIHAGWAAHSGLVAARLAAAGFTGPRGTLDGRFGLYRSHLGDYGWEPAPLTAELGRRWQLLDIGLKPYPCCHFNHAFIDCAAALRRQPGVSPDAIEEVECFIAARQVPIVCEPAASKRTPQNDYDAKFSLPYTVASMLARGHVDIDDFTDAAIRDAAVLSLAQRVVHRDDPDSNFPRRFPGWVRLRLRDGCTIEHREAINRGSAERPLAEAEVQEKFRRNAARALPAHRVEAVIAAVASLESCRDVAQFAHTLCPPP